ncbi:MAG: hypothetical protein H6617_09695 [Bdellovibrionaceae bacterium]|nr:hypothetical protein [Bdellovibrionales bacterium]MCB9254942.1 hypothetical protein [Pseudobdellovibrionaceae bacterium]
MIRIVLCLVCFPVALFGAACPFYPDGGEEEVTKALTAAQSVLAAVLDKNNKDCNEAYKTSATEVYNNLKALNEMREKEKNKEVVDPVKMNALVVAVETGTQKIVDTANNCKSGETTRRLMGSLVDVSWAVMALTPQTAATTAVATIAGATFLKKLFELWDPNRDLKKGQEDLESKALYPKLGCLVWDLQNKKLNCDKEGKPGVGDEKTAAIVASAYGVAIQATQPFFKKMMRTYRKELDVKVGKVRGQNKKQLENRFNQAALPLYQACSLLAGTQIIDAKADGVTGSALLRKANRVERNTFDIPIINPPNHRDDYEEICNVFQCPDNPKDNYSLPFIGAGKWVPDEAFKPGLLGRKKHDAAQEKANEAAMFAHLQCFLVVGHDAVIAEFRKRYTNSEDGSFCRIPQPPGFRNPPAQPGRQMRRQDEDSVVLPGADDAGETPTH